MAPADLRPVPASAHVPRGSAGAPAPPVAPVAKSGTGAGPTLIGSVQRALRLLESAAAHSGGAPAKQLAREARLPLPTAYHLLRTLTHEGYLRREGGVFHLAEAAERLARSAGVQQRRLRMGESLRHLHQLIGAAVYFAVYREGEIDLVSVADSPVGPAVEEWADFRETGHAHAIGQCLLSQLDDEARQDHLSRHPVRQITPYGAPDAPTLLRRLDRAGRMRPIFERQEYALGTECAAIPITVGATAATLAISLPSHRSSALEALALRLQREIGGLLGTLDISISI
ncbi:IclR family transcriptional regulator [Streptomyces sp. NPDC058045]|uniref:IclR family transcriptional regulator n=1 Tax=Streptomyces sp. NPDC058045 TaxID=3346311 RepID=UPI0036EA7DCA